MQPIINPINLMDSKCYGSSLNHGSLSENLLVNEVVAIWPVVKHNTSIIELVVKCKEIRASISFDLNITYDPQVFREVLSMG